MEALRMIEFYDSEILQILPLPFRENPKVQAISYAIQMANRRLLQYMNCSMIYAGIDQLQESALDLLAVELRAPYYDNSFSIEVKRGLVKNALIFYERAGTVSAVENMLTCICGSGTVIEWFEYEGDPGYFQIQFSDLEIDQKRHAELKRLLKKIKRASSHLDKILYKFFYEFYAKILQESSLKITGDIPVRFHEYPLALSINAEIKKEIGFSFEKLDLLSAVLVSFHYENEMGFSFDFYPRANQPYLFLDGTWELDGTDALDGYEGEELIEFYPLQMQIQGEFKQAFATEISRLLIQMDCCVAEEYDAQMEIVSSVLCEKNLESEVTVQGTVQQEIGVEGDLVIEKDLWFLDGSECLDGSRIMDAAVFHHDL